MLPQKARCYVSGASTSATRSATADTHPGAFACGGSQLSRGCSTQREHPRCCGCGGSHTANYHGCVKWKEGKAAVAQQAPERSRQSVATGQPAVLEAQRAGPLPSRWTWARCGITSSEGGGGGGRPGLKKPDLKSTVAPKRASWKNAAARVKTAAATPTTSLVVPTQSPTFPLEDISYLLDNLTLYVYVELTCRILTSISSPPPMGAACPRALLKTVILFVAEYGNTP